MAEELKEGSERPKDVEEPEPKASVWEDSNYVKTMRGMMGGAGQPVRSTASPPMLLEIAKEIQEYIDSKNWSWCDMERVYRILKAANQ